MGSRETWHGSPDARIRGCEVVLPNPVAWDDDDDDDDDSDTEGTCSSSDSDPETLVSSDGATIEAKTKSVLSEHFSQLAATCVVSSFTEHNLHPTQQC